MEVIVLHIFGDCLFTTKEFFSASKLVITYHFIAVTYTPHARNQDFLCSRVCDARVYERRGYYCRTSYHH